MCRVSQPVGNDSVQTESRNTMGLSLEGSLGPGQVLQDRYLIQGVLGRGGMGAVYQARDLHFGTVQRLCAVKEMVTSTVDQYLRDEMVRSFEREAETLATLSHPAIPRIFDFFNFGACVYLVLELIHGLDLGAMMGMTTAFLPVEQVRGWGMQLCDVLTYLHTLQPTPIIFRDMKPSNIMIDKDRRVRLIDFGIARTLQPDRKVTMIGTQGYAAPEMYSGRPELRSDIYALGATLHHLLTRVDPQNERPFSFDERPIRGVNPDVPEALASVVMRALSYDPEQRYPSAEAMKQSLLESDPSTVVTRPHSYAHDTPQPLEPPAETKSEATGAVCAWAFPCEDAVRTRPLVYNGVVYAGADDNNLWAVDAKSGSLRWRFPAGAPITASPAYAAGALYFGSADHKLYALDIRSGKMIWQLKTEGEIHARPAAGSGLVLAGSDDGYLYALKAGASYPQKVWTRDCLAPVRSAPVIENGRIYFGTHDGELMCLDASGAELWRVTGRRRIVAQPLIVDQLIYFGSIDCNIYAVQVDHPVIEWNFRTKGEVTAAAAYADGKVFIGAADGSFYALDSLGGQEVWRYPVGKPVVSAATIFRETVYFGALDGAVYALHAKTGELIWRYQTGGPIHSSPTVADGAIYIGSDDGHIYAFQGPA